MRSEAEHCCDQMAFRVDYRCDQHRDPFECPDNLIIFVPKFREYGLIVHDGGSSKITIAYCPFCGAKLPESMRDAYFDERGID